jgi:hypothetical protein
MDDDLEEFSDAMELDWLRRPRSLTQEEDEA